MLLFEAIGDEYSVPTPEELLVECEESSDMPEDKVPTRLGGPAYGMEGAR